MIETIVGIYLCVGLAMFIETVWRRRKQIKDTIQTNHSTNFPGVVAIAATVGFISGLFVNVFFWPFLLMNKLRNTE